MSAKSFGDEASILIFNVVRVEEDDIVLDVAAAARDEEDVAMEPIE